MNFYYARRYEEARVRVNKALEIDPDYQDGLNCLGAIYEQHDSSRIGILGAQGWELVAIMEYVTDGKKDHAFFFKRPKS